MTQTTREDLDALSLLGSECFGASDDYTPIENITHLLMYSGGGYLLHKSKGIPAGYLLYLEHGDHIEGVRMGVSAPFRRHGLAIKLIKDAIKIAHAKKKPFKTYTSFSNIGSLNAHIKSGMIIDFIDEWIHVKSTTNKK